MIQSTSLPEERSTMATTGTCSWRGGFTLVELLLVLAILGLLAAIVVPQFVSAAAEARENTIKMDLHRIRTQLEIYREQHGSTPPTLAGFVDQMTKSSASDGSTAAPGTPGYPLGPYIREIPLNPNFGNKSIGNGVEGTSAWYYDEKTSAFHANDSVVSRQY